MTHGYVSVLVWSRYVRMRLWRNGGRAATYAPFITIVSATFYLYFGHLILEQPSWWVPYGTVLAEPGLGLTFVHFLTVWRYGAWVAVVAAPLLVPSIVIGILLFRLTLRAMSSFINGKQVEVDYLIIAVAIVAGAESVLSHYVGIATNGYVTPFYANPFLGSQAYPDVGATDIGVAFACCFLLARIRIESVAASRVWQAFSLAGIAYTYVYFLWVGVSLGDLIGSFLLSVSIVALAVSLVLLIGLSLRRRAL